MKFRFFLILALSAAHLGQAEVFSFSNDPIDVVIPSVEKDLLTLQLCIAGIRKNGANVRRIIVVSKNKLTDQAEWFNEKMYPFSLSDVALALAKGDRQKQELLLQKGGRAGWYYQQLLKLYAFLVIPDISSNILVLDSDTVFLNPVTFLNDENEGMYNPGIEYHPPYFQHGALLIPGFYKCFPDYSGISHHMIFQKAVLDSLFSTVERIHSDPFWQVFCRCVSEESLFHSGASEYEIYFNYIFSRTHQISIRKLEWKNINRLSDIEPLKKKGFHYVSIHSYDRIEE